ncbi:DUF1853 family protein [Winogradskyella sp.]|uniref:DUF1853 family protein n=1 Tax=Winogradskyella sp. TaxID=1883156 RepID=UPI0025E4E185|nr:DUF1853 family protein [Winogradskyella sp.]MBT8245391.1 DUF1853 family protein [Winogradskyella sp.]
MKNNVALQYQGFIDTHNLWENDAVLDLFQFEIKPEYFQISKPEDFNEIRLGKRVEQFFNFQIKNTSNIELLDSNIQIKKDKLTIGELDALILEKGQPIHIEIIYKFYLFDPNIEGENELRKWIGPNRKDVFIYKLNKLLKKQLPLLHSKYSETTLKDLGLEVNSILQKVYYKAQLFLPFQSKILDIKPLNPACICGFYTSYSKIEQLKGFQFYIPRKLDWLIIPHHNVGWISFSNAKELIENFIRVSRSPMVWIKKNNELKKCFITYW